ncbi:RHS repeat-associated core domain-containing protein [Pseudomonas silesiensis]
MSTSTSVHSNAFNFTSFIQSQVDPRTGQYTCAISLPELKANNLCGPVVPLQLNFNPLNAPDSGYGKCWNLQLSQYNTASRVLSLYTGETFRIDQGLNGLEVPEQKIESFHIHKSTDTDGQDIWRVDHKSGLVEILKVKHGQIALPIQMRSPQGHSVTLHYESFGTEPLLSRITNDTDGSQLFSLERTTNLLTLTLHPGSAYQAVFKMIIEGGESKSFILPTDNDASWRFGYVLKNGLTCLKEVFTPTGGHETVTYSDRPHYFPGLNESTLPRVKTHISDPGFKQPAIETRYEYDENDYNFLGRGSGVSWNDDGLDNLYRARSDYQYETTQILWDAEIDKAVSRTRRVFNRFHLLTLEETTQHSTDPDKGDTYHRIDTDYYIKPDLSFEEQDPYCQLPKSVTKTWRRANTTTPRHVETVATTYDDFGNLLTQVNANGVTETSEWYDKAGEQDEQGRWLCPADPQGFVRNLKSKTVTPATSDHGKAPTLQTRYRYGEHPGLTGSGPWLALSDETLAQMIDGRAVTELRRIDHEYIIAPEAPQKHGLISKVLRTLHGRPETLTTTRYSYCITSNARSGAMVMRTTNEQIGFDDNIDEGKPIRRVIAEEQSLLTGDTLLSEDDNDAKIASVHDRLGRVIEEIVAPDSTEYKASRTYTYTLTNALGQQATQSTCDVKDVETITYLDGLNRVIRETRRDADALGGDAKKYREIYRATYNNRGQLISETSIDWEDEKDIPLTSEYQYDAWGEQCRVVGPDGVAQVSELDPPTQTLCTWTESIVKPIKVAGKSRSTINRFGKEDKVEALDAQDKVVSTQQYKYDGLGNCVEQINALDESTRFEFDLFSRVRATIMPDSTEIRRAYAAHSEGELAIDLTVMIDEKPVSVGTQTYDGLERRTALKVGPRLQGFEYKAGQSQVSTMITASNKKITYEYKPGLVATPVGSIAPDEQSSFNYDSLSAQLTLSENTQGKNVFTYSSTGQLLKESWTDTLSKKQWETTYTHTLNGRLLTRLVDEKLDCTCTYDDAGRLDTLTQGDLKAKFDYDELGQVSTITTCNLHTEQTLKTTLTFDDQGREFTRVLELAGHPTQTISQTYRIDSKLHTRHLQVDDQTELLETFGYDQRGRMVEYECEGSALPRDRYNNAIRRQDFVFDALDNITVVTTRYEDGTRDIAISSFSLSDPCQLVKVTHNHPSYGPDSSWELQYDADGNLMYDENGQALHYDTQGRLLSVTNAGQSVSQYRYDAHNHLLGVTQGGTETLRFYQGDRLSRTEQGEEKIHYLYHDDQPLGQQQENSPEHTLLLLTDGKNSVLAESDGNELRKAVYGAYGERNPDDEFKCLLGFNGEVRDKLSGWYLLGRGYRAYNPTLMRFHSPDSLSPFGAGGINPYMYCAGDPINFVDPTGHANRGADWEAIGFGFLAAVGAALGVASAIAFPPSGLLMSTVGYGFAAAGVVTGSLGIKDAVLANTATKAKDRREAKTRAMWEGIGGAATGAFGLRMGGSIGKKLAKEGLENRSLWSRMKNFFGGGSRGAGGAGSGAADVAEEAVPQVASRRASMDVAASSAPNRTSISAGAPTSTNIPAPPPPPPTGGGVIASNSVPGGLSKPVKTQSNFTWDDFNASNDRYEAIKINGEARTPRSARNVTTDRPLERVSAVRSTLSPLYVPRFPAPGV